MSGAGQSTEGMRNIAAQPSPALPTLAWFADLWLARQTGDRQREARARHQLRSLGVDVLIDEARTRDAETLVARRKQEVDK